jgi:hypothetical protein
LCLTREETKYKYERTAQQQVKVVMNDRKEKRISKRSRALQTHHTLNKKKRKRAKYQTNEEIANDTTGNFNTRKIHPVT